MIVVRKQVYERRRPVNASRIVVTCPSRMVLQALTVGRGNRPARLHKRADTRLLGLINEMQPAEMPSRGAVACRRKDYIDAHLGG